jgi:hypothetical protein
MNTIAEFWNKIKGYAQLARSAINRVVFAGPSRDDAYYIVSVGALTIRHWKNRSPVWDIILWWPKIRVIKGQLAKEDHE